MTTSGSTLTGAPRIGLFGPYASRNLGDTATQMTVISNLRRRIPGARFIGVSPEPRDTLESLGIPAFPMSGVGASAGELKDDVYLSEKVVGTSAFSIRAAGRISAFVRSLDLLVISGGGQLDDFWGGPWGHPWSMLLWTTLARRHRVPVAYLAVGIDKLDSKLSRRFCVWSLNGSTWRSFRDPASHTKMLGLGLRGSAAVCPDVVFGLAPPVKERACTDPSFVVLSPISRRTWARDETQTHQQYMDALTECGLYFSRLGLDVKIICSQPMMDGDDARQLERSLSERGAATVTLCKTPTVTDFLLQVGGAELVIASRLHAVILSLITGAPVVAVAHLAKVDAAMKAVGLDEFCLAMKDVGADDLVALSERAYVARQALARQVKQANSRLKSELEATFNALASLMSR
jgi:polysaccharide pyruvyl transferase WcaK-like protein